MFEGRFLSYENFILEKNSVYKTHSESTKFQDLVNKKFKKLSRKQLYSSLPFNIFSSQIWAPSSTIIKLLPAQNLAGILYLKLCRRTVYMFYIYRRVLFNLVPLILVPLHVVLQTLISRLFHIIMGGSHSLRSRKYMAIGQSLL